MFDEAEVEKLIEAAIAKAKADLGQYAAQLIEFQSLKARLMRTLRQLYLETGVAGKGGALTQDERTLIESAVQDQLMADVGNEDYGLSEKIDDYEQGSISLAQFTASLAMYFKSSRSASMQVWAMSTAEGEERLVKRKLGATDNHCAECLLYAALPAMRLKDAVIPGRECSCYTNCLCLLVDA